MIGHQVIGGGAEAVLVLPDWFGGSAYMTGLAPVFESTRYRYIIADFRGYGRSKDQSGTCSIAEMVSDAIALADSLEIERFHLVGHSMGGKAAQLIVARHPERLKAVVLLTPTPPTALEFDAGTRALLEDCEMSATSRRTALDAATGNQYSQDFLDNLAAISMRASRGAAHRAYLDAWSGTDISAELGINDQPLLVVIGARDPFVPESAIQEHIAPAFPAMRLVTLEGVGHYPLLEAAPKTLALMDTEFSERS